MKTEAVLSDPSSPSGDATTRDVESSLREGVKAITGFINDGEWADLLTTDPDLSDLEEAVRQLIEAKERRHA